MVARIMDLTNGLSADSVLECVGTQESMMQAIHAARPGGYVGYVGVPHGVELNGEELPPRSGGGGLPHDGRTPSDKDALAAMTSRNSSN